MTLNALRRLVSRLKLVPRTALTWGGRVDRADVLVALDPRADGVDVKVTVSPTPLRRGLFATPNDLWLGADDGRAKTADHDFDQAVALRLGHPELLGFFGFDNRPLIAGLLASGRVVIDDGAFVVYADSRTMGDIAEVTESVIMLANTMSLDDESLVAALFEMAWTEPTLEVRARVLEVIENDPTLARQYAAERARQVIDDEDTGPIALLTQVRDATLALPIRGRALLRLIETTALDDSIAHIERLGPFFGALAATDKGAPYSDFVGKLAPLLMAEGVDPRLGLRVIKALWPYRPSMRGKLSVTLSGLFAHFALEESVDMIRVLLDTNDKPQFDAALAALTAIESVASDEERVAEVLGPKGLKHLARSAVDHARNHRNGATLLILAYRQLAPHQLEEGCAVLNLLAEVGDSRHESFLIPELGSFSELIRDVTIAALGKLGTEKAIAALQPLTTGFFRSSELKAAAKSSIDAIRTRLGRIHAPGALSLADAKPGALSVAED